MIYICADRSLDDQMRDFARVLTERITSVSDKPDRIYLHCLLALTEAYKCGASAQRYRTDQNFRQLLTEHMGRAEEPSFSSVTLAHINTLLKQPPRQAYGYIWNRLLDGTYKQHADFYPDDAMAFHKYLTQRWEAATSALVNLLMHNPDVDRSRYPNDPQYCAELVAKHASEDTLFKWVLHATLFNSKAHNFVITEVVDFLMKRFRKGKLRKNILDIIVAEYEAQLEVST